MPTPLDSKITPAPRKTSKRKYAWDSWLIPGKALTFTQGEDFPDVEMSSFRQGLRNAVGRRNKRRRNAGEPLLDYDTEKVNATTVNVWVYVKENDEQLPAPHGED